MLNQSPSIYTEILTNLNIENGLLNYHLENMKELLTKDEGGRYKLSEFGRAAINLRGFGLTHKIRLKMGLPL